MRWLGTVAAHLASSGGRRGRLSILIFHRVLMVPDPLRPGEPTVELFRWQMELLQRHFNVLPLAEAANALRMGKLPPRAACVTFDDGYRDNVDLALPVLLDIGIPATFFIATGFLEGGRMWNDTIIEVVRSLPSGELNLAHLGLGKHELRSMETRCGVATSLVLALKFRPVAERQQLVDYLAGLVLGDLPSDLMMSSDHVGQLTRAGMEVGGHTVTHPILAGLSLAEAEREIVEGRQRLEELTGARVTSFAYPNGKPGRDYLPEHASLVRELGFTVAVSTLQGVSGMATSAWELRRFTPWEQTPGWFLPRLVLNAIKST